MTEERLRAILCNRISRLKVSTVDNKLEISGVSKTYYGSLIAMEEAKKMFSDREIVNRITVR